MRNSSKWIFFDLETAGFNPERHPIIQIAAIAVDGDLNPIEAFEAKIRFDEKKALKNSLRKNHYSRALWAQEAKNEREVAKDFADFLRRHASAKMTSTTGDAYHISQLVAHNADFDGPFLQVWFERLKLYLPARRQVLCTLQRARWYFEEHPSIPCPKDFKLATLCQYFKVPFHAASAHEALADVAATVGLYRAIHAPGRLTDSCRMTPTEHT